MAPRLQTTPYAIALGHSGGDQTLDDVLQSGDILFGYVVEL